MANLLDVADVIATISDTFEDAVVQCMDDNREVVADMIREQLYSGVDGKGNYLSPTYSQDPYFQEMPGHWYGRSEQYRTWKEVITPPESSMMLGLPPRPVDVPNLFIVGTFHASIRAEIRTPMLHIFTSGFADGPQIERKYGEDIFMPGEVARAYFNENYLKPYLLKLFEQCGYR